MKMIKGSVKEFTQLFGHEGVKLANKHKVNVILAKLGDFPELESETADEITNFVLYIHPVTHEVMPKDGTGELTMVFYPAPIKQSAARLREGAVEKGQALENKVQRFITSHLAYSLARVAQMNDRRFKICSWHWIEWEGALMETNNQLNVETPWERECYIAQFEFMTGSRSKALKLYNQMVDNVRQAQSSVI